MNLSIKPSVSLLRHFENIEDPRTDYLIEHQLLDIIAITICAVICGAETWGEIEEYGTSKQEWLQKFLALPNGIPSKDTIRRYWLLSSVEHLVDGQLWSGLKRVGLVESERRIQGKPPTFEKRYYLLSLDGGVERFVTRS